MKKLFNMQIEFQQMIKKKYNQQIQNIPEDNVELYKYHMLALLEEVGELLKSDKRWKMLRNSHYDKGNKLEEAADVFITMFNICIFSNISYAELFDTIYEKIKTNVTRARGEI